MQAPYPQIQSRKPRERTQGIFGVCLADCLVTVSMDYRLVLRQLSMY